VNRKDRKKGLQTVIVTGDMDLLQLVSKNTKVYLLKRGIKNMALYDKQKVEKRYNLSPTLLADYKALVGDVSDNIPGVSGIGPKTAIKLLKKFGSLERIYENIENAKCKKNGEPRISSRVNKILQDNRKNAFLSRDLAKTRKDAPVEFKLEECVLDKYDKEKTEAAFRKLGFKTLIPRLPGNKRKQKLLI
jgi:DNA polymerase-1